MSILKIISISVILVSTAFTRFIDQQDTLFEDVKLSALKTPRHVEIKIESKRFSEFEEIVVERSTDLNGYYRQMRIIYRPEIEKAIDNTIIIKDMYPINIQNAGCYRVRVKTLTGIMRTYPGVQEISYDKFNEERNKKTVEPIAADTKKTALKSNDDVEELEVSDREESHSVIDEKSAQLFSDIMSSTTFKIQRESELGRKISIDLPPTERLENIFVMMSNEKDRSYYTIKEFNKIQIQELSLKGKLEYQFKLDRASLESNKNYSIKLRMTSSNFAYETASVGFN